MISAGALRLLKEIVLGVLLSWLSSYTYKHIVEPLEASPSLTGNPINVSTAIGSSIAPPHQPERGDPPPPPPPDPEHSGPVVFPDGTRADVYPHVCRLPEGRSLDFRVVVFSESYSWAFEDTDRVQLNDRLLGDAEFVNRLQSPGLQEIMARANALIAVGTASCEGSEWSREDDRALQRARTLEAWIENARPWGALDLSRTPRSLYLLNLGRYWKDPDKKQTCGDARPEDTWHQRKVVLMAILQPTSQADLQWCIGQSLRGDPQLGRLLLHYSRFDLDKKPRGEDL